MLQSTVFNEEHELFRDTVRRFMQTEIEPHMERWETKGRVPRDIWLKAGDCGMLCPGVPPEYGGPGVDFLFNVIVAEETGYAIGGGSLPFSAQSDILAYYLLNHGSEDIKQRWLPKMVSGEVLTAIAMTEPGAGSDLKAIRTRADRDGDYYVLNGAKTFITNGVDADLFVVACKTDLEAGAKGISLLLVESSREGFGRGRHLDKIGQKASGTCELSFENVRVPVENRLGEEGAGFPIMMEELPRERLNIAVRAFMSALRGYELTVEYAQSRSAFGKKVVDFQANRHALADMKTELSVGRVFLDNCLRRLIDGELSATDAAMAKLWISELEWRVLDQGLQLHGGYGYILEYPIARLFTDARSRRIYGGTSEIMRDYIARQL